VVEQADQPIDEARRAEFVRLLTSHQLDIYFYVHSLVPDPNDAAEILQDTNVVLWEKCGQFDVARDFRPWAFQVARYEVLKYRTKRKRKCLCFSDALVDELALQAPAYAAVDDDFIEDMRRCVAQLPATDREVLNRRYSSEAPCESIAEAVGRPVRWVYKALSRIRRELLDCMARHTNARREP
jgi:RNA polymerase sigma-70 factor, ECF subfamily